MRLHSLYRVAFVLTLPLLAASARADTIGIGTAAPFAVLGEAGVTNAGATTLYGSVAGSTGTPSVTGLVASNVIAPGVLITTGVANSGVGTPFGDAAIAYGDAEALGAISEGTSSLGAGGITSLNPGVYSFTSATLNLNGTLMLNAGGSNNATWTFQVPSLLVINGGSTVEIVNAGAPGAFTGSITWVVGDAANFSGSPSSFLGTIISDGASPDTLTSGDTIQCGRVISLIDSVTLIDDTIAIPDCTAASTEGSPGTGDTVGYNGAFTTPTSGGSVSTPEPGTFVLLLAGLGGLLAFRKVRGAGPADCA
jgi:hypothetical protein